MITKILFIQFSHYIHVPNPLHVCTLNSALDECKSVWVDNPLAFLAMVKDIVGEFFSRCRSLGVTASLSFSYPPTPGVGGVSVGDACDRL